MPVHFPLPGPFRYSHGRVRLALPWPLQLLVLAVQLAITIVLAAIWVLAAVITAIAVGVRAAYRALRRSKAARTAADSPATEKTRA